MEFDPTFTWSNIFALAAMVFSLGGAIFTLFRTRRTDVSDKFAAVDTRFKAGSDRMNGLELRVQATEQKLATMPEKDDIHSLQLLLSEMGGELKAMRASMRAIAESQTRLEHISSRHEDYLRENT